MNLDAQLVLDLLDRELRVSFDLRRDAAIIKEWLAMVRVESWTALGARSRSSLNVAQIWDVVMYEHRRRAFEVRR